MSEIYGYIRVSSADQNEDRQLVELLRWGVPKNRIYLDKQSGKDFNRPRYLALKRKLRERDVVVVKSIDRLGRDYLDIQEEWRDITRRIGADIVIIDMPLLDTRRDRDLTGTLISDIVLQLLSYVAQTEREFIHQRQAEGIAAARSRGVHLGRFAAPIPDGFTEVYQQFERHELTRKQAAEKLGITVGRFDWIKRRYRSGK